MLALLVKNELRSVDFYERVTLVQLINDRQPLLESACTLLFPHFIHEGLIIDGLSIFDPVLQLRLLPIVQRRILLQTRPNIDDSFMAVEVLLQVALVQEIIQILQITLLLDLLLGLICSLLLRIDVLRLRQLVVDLLDQFILVIEEV